MKILELTSFKYNQKRSFISHNLNLLKLTTTPDKIIDHTRKETLPKNNN